MRKFFVFLVAALVAVSVLPVLAQDQADTVGVVIEEFTATAVGLDVTLAWRTSAEDIETMFRLYRETEETGVELIAEISGAGWPDGAKYEVIDAGLEPNFYVYLLTASGEPGEPLVTASASVTVNGPTAVRLTRFGAK